MKTDVVIIGGGPAGSTSAMFLAREGIQSIIIEKETFPRFHIGESMTGECGAVVRELGLEMEMQKRCHPQKQGVTVYGTEGKNRWWVPVMQRTEAGELKDQVTWQVRRSDFDRMMLEEAVNRGSTLINGQALKPLLSEDGAVRGVQIRTAEGDLIDIEAEVLLDCSGQGTFLANAGITGPKYVGNYDKQVAIFSHFTGALRGDNSSRQEHEDNTLIFYQKKYHWGWFIPVDKEVVSVGIVVPSAYLLEKKESKADFLMREIKELNPELSRRMNDIKMVEEARAAVNYSYQVRDFGGRGFLCVGDAHRFLDPIFSFGLYVAMKEAQLAAKSVKAYLGGKDREAPNPFLDHIIYAEKGIDVLEDALDTFWENPLIFAHYVHLRYTEQMIDVFAGRIYDNQPSEATQAFRKALKRERTYDEDGLFSVPIGSRYHPERASLWQTEASATI